jgi:hypothetical protein
MQLGISPEFLSPKRASTPGFDGVLWEKKTLNLFRGVIQCNVNAEGAAEVASYVRQLVVSEYQPGLVVPFAFGTILHFNSAAPAPGDMFEHIDGRARSRGTWQWTIVCDRSTKRAYGIHTWLHGYLTPVYRDLLTQLASHGYSCTSQDKPTDSLFVRIRKLNFRLAQVGSVLAIIGAVLSAMLIAGKAFKVW